MFEAEALILAVEKYPCVWNIHDNDYHNRDVKDLAWEEICKEVLKDWDTYSNVEKKNTGADLKKKWTNIRDYFRKDLQKNQSTPTGSAAKKVKKYVYADLLYFLIPVFDKRHTEGSCKIEVTEDNNSREFEFETQEEQVEQVDDHTNIQPPSLVSTPPASNSKRKRKDIPTLILSIPDQNQHHHQQKVNQKRQEEEEDDDTKFLLSFRTHMKHMKENKKIEFKLGMLKLLKKINTDTEYCSASPLNYDNFSDQSVKSGSSNES